MDKDGKEVGVNEVGEIYSKSPMLFNEYYKLPEKTEESFKDGRFSAGDMGTKDEDGYYVNSNSKTIPVEIIKIYDGKAFVIGKLATDMQLTENRNIPNF